MYKKQLMFFSSIAMLFSAFFFGCDKESNIGIGLVPDNEKINTSLEDTITVLAHTYQVDRVLSSHSLVAAYQNYATYTDSAGISKFVLGNYYDPVFGQTNASFVTEMIRGLKPEFGPTATVDSLVLQLYFDRSDSSAVVFGDADVVSEINISRIYTPLFPDSFYYSNKDTTSLLPEHITTEYFNLSEFWPKAKIDSVLSIKLGNALGQELIDNADTWSSGKFTNYFNGLLISPSSTSTDGALSLINLTDPRTKVALYYKNDAEDDSLLYNFYIDATCARFNLFNHDYNTGNIVGNLNNPESDLVYVQGAAGLRTKIEFPYLSNIRKSGNWGVNKAELVIPVDEVINPDDYPTPLSLQLRPIIDEYGKLGILDEYVGENLQGVTVVDGVYTFDITYWVQQVIKVEDYIDNYGLVLLVGNENTNPSGVVLSSPKNSNKMKLLLTLTKISD